MFYPLNYDCVRPCSCLSNPVLLDMDPPLDPSKEPPLKNCCKGGYIGCQAQDPDMSLAQFSVSEENSE